MRRLASGTDFHRAFFLASAPLVGTVFSVIGLSAARPASHSLPSRYLTGIAAAGGMAFINSMGSLGGYVGPWMVTVTNHEPSMCPQTRTTPSFLERILPSRPNRAAGKLSSRNRAFGAYRPPYRHFAAHNGSAASGILKKLCF
ncbi:hypothetical protein [Burkholderia sp. WSM2230]|uniref:hypothetical protein n=1 Tax=Burkholderia sp. WSM2230 TaxID=944435 RepID=UPI0012EB31E6|nr:hypothetical protein [Burkholderia sp. WSM2230]